MRCGRFANVRRPQASLTPPPAFLNWPGWGCSTSGLRRQPIRKGANSAARHQRRRQHFDNSAPIACQHRSGREWQRLDVRVAELGGVEKVRELYAANHAELGTSISVDQVRQTVTDVGVLGEEQTAAQARADQLGGQKTLKRASVWSAVLEIYGKADNSKKLKNDPTVVAFRSFMKTGPRKKKPEGTPPTGK